MLYRCTSGAHSQQLLPQNQKCAATCALSRPTKRINQAQCPKENDLANAIVQRIGPARFFIWQMSLLVYPRLQLSEAWGANNLLGSSLCSLGQSKSEKHQGESRSAVQTANPPQYRLRTDRIDSLSSGHPLNQLHYCSKAHIAC